MSAGPPLPSRYQEAGPISGHVDLFDGLRRLEVHEKRRRRRRRRLVIVPAAIVVLVGWSVAGAAATPGNQNFSAKWADWGRSHHAAFLINRVEAFYYSHNAPGKGGRPKGLNAVPTAPGATRGSAPAAGLPAPQPVPLVVTPALSGEGTWQPVGPAVSGAPGMYVAQFRADNVYTSEITTAVWIDPKLLKVTLVPGSTEPGGT